MSPKGRIKKLRQSVKLLHELQGDVNRHTRAWYPILNRCRSDPISLVNELSGWIRRLSDLAEAAVVVQEAKESRQLRSGP